MATRNHPIPSLDGMRALAILLVVVLHGTAVARAGIGPGLRTWLITGGGGDGVEIFFVISGFLITTLLLREDERTGGISLRGFYFRRTFRILPPLYAYLLFVAVIAVVEHLHAPASTMLSSLLFVRNYSTAPAFWATEHTWSLAVEEQFYLLWPPVLVLLMRLRGKAGGRRAASWLAAGLIVASPLLRILQHRYGSAALEHREGVMLHTHLDGLMFGCLLALVTGTAGFERVYTALARFWWVCPLYFLGLHGYLDNRFGAPYLFLVGYTLDSLTIAFFLAWAIRNPESAVGRLLNWRPVAYAGVLSYSVYLWQTFFLHPANTTFAGRYWLSLPALAAAALFSYYLVERPSLRLRDRLWSRHRRRALESQ